jgi:hypothetical protein
VHAEPVRQLPPSPSQSLDIEAARQAPTDQGIYAAWLTAEEALREIGIDGPPPVLVYVGIAVGKGGLRHRLLRHAQVPWWELIDLLASRRTVLPAWWAHAPKNTDRRTLTTPMLARIAEEQARAWHHEHLRWGWEVMTRKEAETREVAVIAAHRPLVNRKGRGYRAGPPPQLKAGNTYEPERAWWLFHAAWLAVLSLEHTDFVRPLRRWHPTTYSLEVATNPDGWPVPLGQGTPRRIRVPKTDRAAERVLAGAARRAGAPQEIQDAVRDDTPASQAFAWWAAYAGCEFRRDPIPVRDALGGALTRRDDGFRAPTRLPDAALRSHLVDLVKLLPYVTH